MPLAPKKHLFANLDAVAAQAVDIRHDLHRHPELGYAEKYACNLVCNELSRLEIPFKSGFAGGTGVVGLITGTGSGSPHQCVALRADLDALPILEATGFPYASVNPGLMHACGHDGHTTILMTTASLLKKLP